MGGQKGFVFTGYVLGIKTEEIVASMQRAYQSAFNLTFNVKYFTKANVELFLSKAFNNAKALGVEAMILDRGIVEDIIARASGQAKVLSSYVKESKVESNPSEAKADEKADQAEASEEASEGSKDSNDAQ